MGVGEGAVHGIEPYCCFPVNSQMSLAAHVIGREIGYEIVVAITVFPPDHLQSEGFLHFFRLGSLSHLLSVHAINDVCAAQSVELPLQFCINGCALRNDESLILCSRRRAQCAFRCACELAEILVADVVAVESETVYVEYRPDEVWSFLAHAVNVKLHEQVLCVFFPHILDGQIHQKVVVGGAPLQIGLASCDVFHQIRRVSPDAVGGAHVYRRIEFPSRPGLVFRRIGRAVEKHVVYSGAEHQV